MLLSGPISGPIQWQKQQNENYSNCFALFFCIKQENKLFICSKANDMNKLVTFFSIGVLQFSSYLVVIQQNSHVKSTNFTSYKNKQIYPLASSCQFYFILNHSQSNPLIDQCMYDVWETRLEILSRPKAPLAITEVLSICSRATPELLPNYSQSTPQLIPSYSPASPRLLQRFSRVTPKLFPSTSRATPEILPSYSRVTPDLLSKVL